MKKLLAVILCCAMALSFTACTKNKTETTVETEAVGITVTDEKIAEIKDEFSDFEGIIYLTFNGEPIYNHANGEDECGNDLTAETATYIGSVSKQFCATAIMILKEQNKLSVDDTLDKYFTEYEEGKNITIKNLLTMRSGIPEMLGGAQGYSADKPESENIEIIKEWVFEQPLVFEPDTKNEYSNTNFFLLANIVEIVSGQHYNDFVRESIFKPLEMNNTGFVSEVKDNDFFSKSLTYDTFTVGEDAEGLCKGAGDIVTTAPDMDKWMTGLVSGKIITEESYDEMIVDYSLDSENYYGYGLMKLYKKGIGHMGNIGKYMAIDYMNKDYGCNLFAVTTKSHDKISHLPVTIMDILLGQ